MLYVTNCPHCGATMRDDVACPRCGHRPEPKRGWREGFGEVFPPKTIVSGILLLAAVFAAEFVAAALLGHPGLIFVALVIGIVGLGICEPVHHHRHSARR